MLDQRYRLGRLLGQGGMACVYLAEDTKLGKAVAVKVLNHEYALQPRVVQRFTQEARAISKVRHPNVIDVTDHGTTPDRSVYLVMELLHGEDLSATLAREGPMSWERLGPIVLQICAALATVHRGGVVHRDIKPSNCFRVRVAGNPDFIKVLDFGIAKVLDGPVTPEAPHSTTGSLLGTPEYMAPELPRGLRADARVDIYAVGVLMYKLLTGTAPFTGEVYMAVLAHHMFTPVEPPRVRAPQRQIPAEVEAIVLRALAKDRDERWPSMIAMADAIAATLPGSPSAALWFDSSLDTPVLTATAASEPTRVRELFPAREPSVGPGAMVVPTPVVDLDPPSEDQPTAVREPVTADHNPRLGPDTVDHPRPPRPRLTPNQLLRACALATIVAAAVVSALVFEARRRGAPATTRAASEVASARPPVAKLPPGTGDKPVAAAAKLPVETGPKGQAPPEPPTGPGPASQPTPEPVAKQPASAPPAPAFDAAAVRRALTALTPRLRTCAALRGVLDAFSLQVQVDRRGAVTGVAFAPGSSSLPADALACMKTVIVDEKFAASARGGQVLVEIP